MSRARLNKNNRRKGALERRKVNVEYYAKKVKEKTDTPEYFTDKLAKAKQEVKTLEERIK